MARKMTFRLGSGEYTVEPHRIDRKKIYGWTEVEATDEMGKPCRIISMDNSGSFLIPRGGTGMAYTDAEGNWVDRSTLQSVDEDGQPAKMIPSSYSSVVELGETVSPERLLDHSVTAFYELSGHRKN